MEELGAVGRTGRESAVENGNKDAVGNKVKRQVENGMRWRNGTR
jgi:hypothetical protein